MKRVFLVFALSVCACLGNFVFEDVTVILKAYQSNNGKAPQTIKIFQDNSLENYINQSSLEMLIIENQTIPELRENSVANLLEIADIRIKNCGLTIIRPKAFNNLPKLNTLILADNLLTEIKYGTFGYLGTDLLRLLDLHNNQISKLDDKAFENLEVKQLDLSKNYLREWKSSWLDGSIISTLRVSSNLIEELPDKSFSYVRYSKNPNARLWNVDFSDNRIKRIHRYAFSGMRSIDYLDLSGNLLEILEVDFHFIYLFNLNLSKNKLKKCYVSGPLEYDSVSLSDNQLECLDLMDFGDFSDLYVDGNPITCDCIKSWDKLQLGNKIHFDENCKSN